MTEDNRRELSKYRIEKAVRCLKSAETLLEDDDYLGAENRAYYAIFHAIRSVLALDGVGFTKHSGTISYFRKQYIKTGIFDIELSDIITSSFDARSDSDYDDFVIVSKTAVEEQNKNASLFVEKVRDYLTKKE